VLIHVHLPEEEKKMFFNHFVFLPTFFSWKLKSYKNDVISQSNDSLLLGVLAQLTTVYHQALECTTRLVAAPQNEETRCLTERHKNAGCFCFQIKGKNQNQNTRRKNRVKGKRRGNPARPRRENPSAAARTRMPFAPLLSCIGLSLPPAAMRSTRASSSRLVRAGLKPAGECLPLAFTFWHNFPLPIRVSCYVLVHKGPSKLWD
jgi:hypothetical protein